MNQKINDIKLHIDDLKQEINWLQSNAYKFHFEKITTAYWRETFGTLEQYLIDEWNIKKIEINELSRDLAHWQEVLIIYQAELEVEDAD